MPAPSRCPTTPTTTRWRAGPMELRGGAPVEITKARTVDLDVPARAEFVIEFEADFTRQVMPNGRKVPAGRVHRLLHPGGALPPPRADRPRDRHHAPERRRLPSAADRDWRGVAADREPHPEAALLTK